MGTVESLIQLGVFAVGGAIGAGEFRKVLPKEIVAFIDRFKPVQMPDGQTRYWEPDLPVRARQRLPTADSAPNELGLHAASGQATAATGGRAFCGERKPGAGQYRIDHPTQPDAYQPLVRHNGDGAWHTELEQPLAWDKPRRCAGSVHSVESFSPTAARNGPADQRLRRRTPCARCTSISKRCRRCWRTASSASRSIRTAALYRSTGQRCRPKRYCALIRHAAATAQRTRSLAKRQASAPARSAGELVWQSSSDETPAADRTLHQGSLIGGRPAQNLALSLDERKPKPCW